MEKTKRRREERGRGEEMRGERTERKEKAGVQNIPQVNPYLW